MNSQRHILLTGAGFTYNFGTPLATGIWNLILNDRSIKKCTRLLETIRQDLDFESVYHTVIFSEGYTLAEKRAMNEAVRSAFTFLDEKIRTWDYQNYPVNVSGVRQLLARFAGDKKSPGFIFTLNQDLFVERYYGDGPSLFLPGFKRTVNLPGGSRPALERDHWLAVPAIPLQPPSLTSQHPFCYVKLHGSFNWCRTSGSNDFSCMVIGRGKSEKIAADPLLSKYLNLFELVLNSGKKRLLVCGYGFRDEHINKVLASAIEKKGMELFILSPEAASSLKTSLSSVPYGDAIWSAVQPFPYSLQTLFPASQSVTPEWRNLCQTYFLP